MGQFAIETRRWLEKIIKQRKTMLRINCSHKPVSDIARALYRLEVQLSFYSYENDLYMARFIQQFKPDIEIILPGEGSTAMEKRRTEFTEINKRSISIIAGNIISKRTQIQSHI
jgi:hypothetical protein